MWRNHQPSATPVNKGTFTGVDDLTGATPNSQESTIYSRHHHPAICDRSLGVLMTSGTSKNDRILSILIAAVLIFATDAMAQDGASADSDTDGMSEELKRKEEQAKIKDAEKRIAEAEAAIARAKGSDTKGLAGDSDVKEGAGYFAEVLAYQSLEVAATEIAVAVADKAGKFILTNNPGLNTERALWTTVELRIRVFEDSFSKLEQSLRDGRDQRCSDEDEPIRMTRAPATALLALTAGLGALSDVLGFFRTDTTLVAYGVDLDDYALLASVAQKLTAAGKTVFIPGLHGGSDGVIATRLGKLQAKGTNLEVLRDKIRKCSADAWREVEALRKEVQEHKADETRRKAAQRKLDAALGKPLVKLLVFAEEQVTAAGSALRDFFNALVTQPKAGEPSPLERIATVDAMKRHPDASYLYLDIVGEGGEVQTTKSALMGGRINYVGGSSSVYVLTDATGIVKASGASTKFRRGWYGARGGVKNLQTE